ncbi:hypothetical protein BD324DRAFT_631222 [Kockovaella imperatae]|uniref:GATA-type domain-containing protein n=1 Tax=Kockovaella imperatae TaxID=4999 RepID=A0A1Y1UCG5_9TREE|nr:hypothetical protein BD324DRAFT_631222 [Kockovaella imperatae]ORX35692.1 hypothetical protein BD324DRAFT_631222 [Kockovaella imperatae]
MISAPPSPHKIHSLPVIINYNIPSTSQTFSTLFPSLHQVYVHANSAASSVQGSEDLCGSIYLKTVVQGVVTASPELHPLHPSTPDLPLYIFDPRETSLRRSRVSSSLPPHLRSSIASSPTSNPSSPAPSYHLQQAVPAPQDVWTGKGLVSWALDEPGLGKQLITGRIVCNSTFATVPADDVAGGSGLGALAALVDREQQGEAWGIEISLCLKSGNGPIGFPSFAETIPMVAPVTRSTVPASHHRPASSAPQTQRVAVKPPQVVSRPPTKPLSPSRRVNFTPINPRPPVRRMTSNASTGRKKKCTDTSHAHCASHPHPHVHPRSTRPPSNGGSELASSSSSSQAHSSDNESFPGDIPATLYSNPDTLTKDQAERLIASPAFLNMLSKLTGRPINATDDSATRRIRMSRKRPAEELLKKDSDESVKKAKQTSVRPETVAGPSAMTEKKTPAREESSSNAALKCWNCGRTKSAVWRTKVMENGDSVRVCNACGLYWNKLHVMRPPSMWQGVDETPKSIPRRNASTAADKPASRIDANAGNSNGGLKRTLSVAVEQDAKRLAQARARPKTMLDVAKARVMAASSPVRPPPTKTPDAIQNAAEGSRWATQPVAASSPGWTRPSTPPMSAGDNFNPVQQSSAILDTPNTHVRKILGPAVQSLGMPSLELPLSDDGREQAQGATDPLAGIDWSTDLSAFFDLEGFSLPQEPQIGHEVTHIQSDVMEQSTIEPKNQSDGNTERSDDVISQLFNATSSVGDGSSPNRFDWSTLPPSSPPIMSSSDLGHSALLLSSPVVSPWDRKPSPAKSSNISTAFTPLSEASNDMVRSCSDVGPLRPTPRDVSGDSKVSIQSTTSHSSLSATVETDYSRHEYEGKNMEELWGQMLAQHAQSDQAGPGVQSSAGAAEGMLDDDMIRFLL